MPKINDYVCNKCAESFEFMHTPEDDIAACPACGSTDCQLQLGGKTFSKIVPMYPGAKAHKAGYVHQYQNRPAEKTYVTVPRTKP